MAVFYQNPFYNYVFGSFNCVVPSTRTGYKTDQQTGQSFPNPISDGVKKFRESIKNWLSKEPDEKWPCTGRLLLAVEFGLVEKDYQNKDIDNITKSLIDSLKGIIFRDDKQIDSLHILKYQMPSGSFFIGIKELSIADPAWYFPPFYAEKPWKTDIQKYCVKTKQPIYPNVKPCS